MRLPYIPDPPEFTEEADKAVLERIKERRGPKGLIALDRTLLHSPPVADGWYVDLAFISFYGSEFASNWWVRLPGFTASLLSQPQRDLGIWRGIQS